MGLKISHNQAIFFYFLVEEFMLGAPDDIENPFTYETVKFNLPSSVDYDPTIPCFIVRDGYG